MSECVIKGPYHPVGDVDFECRTHGVVAVLRDPTRYGAGDIRLDEVRCPVGEPTPDPAPGVHVEALCEPCGVWHSVEVKPVLATGELITEVRPVCWICGYAPLVIVGSGRVH